MGIYSLLGVSPHILSGGQDKLLAWKEKGFTPVQIHAKLAAIRDRKDIEPQGLTGLRKFLKGKTHKRGAAETRGNKCTFSKANVRNMNKVRKELVKKVKGTKYIKWDTIVRKARVPTAHRTTAAKAFQRANIPAKWRANRQKPQRNAEHIAERVLMTDKIRKYPVNYFGTKVDMIQDNKMWPIATTPEARDHLRKSNVVGQIRLPSEGLTYGIDQALRYSKDPCTNQSLKFPCI